MKSPSLSVFALLAASVSLLAEVKLPAILSDHMVLQKSGREDRPNADPSAFAGTDISTDDWKPATIPGPITGPGLTGLGAVWVRTEVNLDATSDKNMGANFGVIEGFDQIYWDGKLLTSQTVKSFPGTGYIRRWGNYNASDLPASPFRTDTFPGETIDKKY